MTKFEMNLHTIVGSTFARGLYKKYVEQLDLTESKSILEFGSGAGCITKYLAKKIDNNTKLYCLDIDTEAIDLSKKRFSAYNNINYYVGDIRKLDIEDNIFDTIIIHYMFHDIPEKDRIAILEKLSKVLSAGGKLYIREPIKEGHGISATEVRRLMKKIKLIEIKGQLEKCFIGGAMFSALFEKE